MPLTHSKKYPTAYHDCGVYIISLFVCREELVIDGTDTTFVILAFHADDDVQLARALVNHIDVDTAFGQSLK